MMNSNDESVIKTLTQFVETSGFVGMDLTTVATMIQKLSHDGLITKTRFDIAVERILSIPMRDIDRINNAMILSSIFYAFDRTGSDVVDTVELTCGLAVICEGSKSSKLSLAFELIDENSDGILTKRGLWRYFRSFLCVIFTITGAALDMTNDEMIQICDECAIKTSVLLLQTLPDAVTTCTFENLADWYTTGGYKSATWLELLDLSKWLLIKNSPSINAAGASSRDAVPENPFVEEDGVEIFRADLQGGNRLSIMESDTNFVLEIAQLALFLQLEPANMVHRLSAYQRDGMVSIRSYNQFIKVGVAGSKTEEQLSKISYALSSIYFSYDDDGENQVPFASLVTGLCVLCSGSKSVKLSTCFGLFDGNNDGFLTKRELGLFLAAYLRLLLGCSFSSASSRRHGATSAIANTTCSIICNDVFQNDHISKVDFQYFGDWYNDGGFRLIPWLELIDLSKWVRITSRQGQGQGQGLVRLEANSSSSQESPGAKNMNLLTRSKSDIVDEKRNVPVGRSGLAFVPPRDSESESDSSSSSSSSSASSSTSSSSSSSGGDSDSKYDTKVVPSDLQLIQRGGDSSNGSSSHSQFSLSLLYRNSAHIIRISAATVTKVHAVAVESGLANLHAENVSKAILDITKNTDNLLSIKDFFRFLEKIEPNRRTQFHTSSAFASGASGAHSNGITSPMKDWKGDLFSSLFHAFDRTGSTIVDAREIACGLSILCSGSKSSKLAEAFDLLDEDRDGSLSRRGLWKYFRSFLCALLILSNGSCNLTNNDITRMADGSALLACDSVLSLSLSGKACVTFDDVADWYSSTGYRVAPWLELLDMSKWQHLINVTP